MNRTSIAGALLLALTTPSAFAQGYVKLELGSAIWDVDIADFDDGSLGGTLEPADTLLGFGFGYAVNQHLAIETTWRDLGAATFEGSSNGAGSFWCAGPVRAELEATSLDVTVLGKVPVDPEWAFTGRLGVSQWDATTHPSGLLRHAHRRRHGLQRDLRPGHRAVPLRRHHAHCQLADGPGRGRRVRRFDHHRRPVLQLLSRSPWRGPRVPSSGIRPVTG